MGDKTSLRQGAVAYYYHLKVTNSRSFVPARNCRVMLKQLHRRGPDSQFQPEILVVPLQYAWAPSEWAPVLQTVAGEAVFDFGRIVQSSNFQPTLYTTSTNFRGFVNANEAVRFSLQVIADNYVSPRMQVFEVAWNGKWADTREEMQQNVVIKEVEATNRGSE